MTKHKYKELDYSSFTLLKTHLKSVKTLDIEILGLSMVPLLDPEGHKVKVLYVEDLKILKKFDVIIFWQNNILICHYYWKVNKYFNDPVDPTIVTRPLNPIKNFDHPIKYNDILGIVDQKLSIWMKIKVLCSIIF